MLDTTLVLLLQERASPALTEIMRAVSFCGYVPSCLAIAIVCGFGWRLRLGVTLILAIVFADAMTMVAKDAFASSRPHAVDARVQTLDAFGSWIPRMPSGAPARTDDFGFPSGHVAATAAWTLGLAWSRRKRRHLGAAATWIAAMAVSRMYLGRHFPADVIGGLGLGAAALVFARVTIPPVAGPGGPGAAPGTRLGVAVVVLVVLAALSGAGPDAHDAGRFSGLVGAVLLLTRRRTLDDAVTLSTRMARMAVALVLLGVAIWSSTWTIATIPVLGSMTAFALSAALHASVLLVPVLAL
jgi:membrane-associated phospholipid phosphatase